MTDSATQPIIRARDLTKQYGSLRAVDGVTFEIEPSRCVAFLGPNGAGKTTLLRMVFSLIAKTGGELYVLGLEPMRQRKLINRHLGVVFQDNNLDEELNVTDSLLVHAAYSGLSLGTGRQRIADLLEWMGLTAKARNQIRELSGGMTRRLMIARALLNRPRLLLLDEPTTGLDPQVRHAIWALLRDLKRQGMTILLTTHYMEEAQQLADQVMIMDHGQVLLSGTPKALIADHLERYVLQVSGLDGQLPAGLDSGVRHEHAGDADFFYSNEEHALQRLYDVLDTPYTVLRHANLEDVFLRVTGRGLTDV